MSDSNSVIGNISVAPMRAQASDRSEMVSQLLLGETADVIDIANEGSWLKIRHRSDGYEGWINANEAMQVSEKGSKQWESDRGEQRWPYASLRVSNDKGEALIVPFGAALQWNEANREVVLGNRTFNWSANILPVRIRQSHPLLTALMLRGTPYLWGGRSDLGMDCSGFMQLVLQVHKLTCHRDASQQVTMGEPVGDLNSAQPGDWLFFDVKGTGISHVGWYLGDQLLLHASGQVKVQRIATSQKKRFNEIFSFNETLAETLTEIRRISAPKPNGWDPVNKSELSKLLLEIP
jgi:cell wall-associated NlpC family hydrolase